MINLEGTSSLLKTVFFLIYIYIYTVHKDKNRCFHKPFHFRNQQTNLVNSGLRVILLVSYNVEKYNKCRINANYKLHL